MGLVAVMIVLLDCGQILSICDVQLTYLRGYLAREMEDVNSSIPGREVM